MSGFFVVCAVIHEGSLPVAQHLLPLGLAWHENSVGHGPTLQEPAEIG